MKKNIRIVLGFIILAATIIAFIRYAATHPSLIHTLGDLNPVLMLALVALYLIFFAALVVILRLTLHMWGTTMPRQENVLLNAYSTLANFFGPGQSGPALRALYLKKRHGLGIKKYLLGTLIYYGCYAVISAFMLFVGSRPWWQTALLVFAAAGSSWFVIRWYAKRSKLKDGLGFESRYILYIFLATAVQLAVQAVIFGVELHSVDAHASIGHVISYTGAANFSLFVALTPGAIGIREAFLAFTGQLHHISSNLMIAANVIDRAVYLVFLGVLFVFALSLHAKDTLRIKQVTADTPKDSQES